MTVLEQDNRITVPSRKVFRNEKYSGGFDPEFRIRTHIVVEDNKRVGTGKSIELVDTCYGRMLLSNCDQHVYSWLKNPGIYAEDWEIVRVRDLLAERPRGMFVDVGANVGCWSLALAYVAEKVLAIEPQRAVYNLLCGSVALNGLSRRIFPMHCALGDVRTQAPILTADLESKNNFGGLSLAGQVPEDVDPRFVELVDVYPLSDLIEPDEHVSFIKIDVEGFEEQVLFGMLEVIARCRPIILIEWALSDELKLGRQLRELGYVLEYIQGNWLCLPIP